MIVLMKLKGERLETNKQEKAKQNIILVCVVNTVNTTGNITWMPVEKIQRFVI